MEILSTIFYFIITIGVLVLVHELGHFIAAKMFNMRVDTFSIGFPPRAFGKKIGETDYCVSWIPIGGYVKIAGMIDESMDTEFLNHEPQPWEFRSRPIWQRAIVLSGGVLMNVLLAIGIFWGIIYYQGRTIRPVTEIGYVAPESSAAKLGLRIQDKIIAINNKPIRQWDEIESSLYTESVNGNLVLHILRNGNEISIPVKQSELPDMVEERFGIWPTGLVPIVASVDHGKPAASIGLQPGDTIVAVNNIPVTYGSLPEQVKANTNKEMLLTWSHQGNRIESKVTPTSEGRIGIMLSAGYVGPVVHENFGLFEALPIGVSEVVITSKLFLANIYQIIVGKVSLSKSVGGPVKIAQMANRSAESGFITFIGFMALLSISLALLNILPFPALDGGHLVFLLYEGIFRKQVPDKIKIAIQRAGFFLLLVFMAFVLYNDVINF